MSAAPDPGEQSGPTALPPPVRERLVQIASDVLGALEPEDVPTALRAIARFTPPKRVRLGAVALAAAVDTDEQFRERVADAVEQSSSGLTEAVREGRTVPASDPYDVAVVAYLLRPAGWRTALTDATAWWTAEHSGREATDGRLAELRDEVARLRAQVKEQARDHAGRLRDAAVSAGASAAQETTRLRNALRERTAELRDARAAADRARADREEQVRATADAVADADRWRERADAAERTASEGRRDVRNDREFADARVRLLLDTLADAAAGLRRELALPAGTARPADAVDAESGRSTARGIVDVAGLDEILALPQVHVVVDGYNVTKTGYGELPLADQRTRLVAAMATLRARSGAEVTVAFDGAARPPVQPPAPRGVRVLFSAPGELADDLIRRLVAAEPSGRVVLVVTADRAVVDDVRRAGAWTVLSAVFLQRL